MPFAHVGEGEGEVAEVAFVAYDVPGAFENEGADVGEDGEFAGGGLQGLGFLEVWDHWGLFAVATFDGEDARFGEETFYTMEYLAYGGVVWC